MFIQFLIEDYSTEVLVCHVMKKIQEVYKTGEIYYSIRSFKGIGHLPKEGSIQERKTGQLLNDLPLYLRGFNKSLSGMSDAQIIVVLDNDMRDPEEFQQKLQKIVIQQMINTRCTFCLAIKEMEAWLLGDRQAIIEAYPNARMQYMENYEQDALVNTWEILADVVYPGGLNALIKKADGAYQWVGIQKAEWADKIGEKLHLEQNNSQSFQKFLNEIKREV